MARSPQEIREGLNYLRRCRGTRYVGWNGVWPPNQPVFYMGTGKPPSPEAVKAKGVLCSGALNLFARFVRGRSGQGTLWWEQNLENKRQFRSGTRYPIGTVLGYPFARDNDGHVVIVSTEPDENGNQMTIGADVPFGLNEKRTVRSAHATFNFTYAADIPGIGVIRSGDGGASEDVVELIDEHLNEHGQVIYEEARRTGLELALACALVQQESLGRNIFGHDWGQQFADRVPFAHLPVTEQRVQALLRHVRNGGTSNGVGLTQLTYPPFIQEAEKIGGAHLPRYQCRVGFRLLASYVDKYNYMEALGAYNAGETNRRAGITNDYAGQLAEKHRQWKQRLGGRVREPATTRDARIVLGSYMHPPSELAHLAGAALHRAGVNCQVATGQRFVQLEEQCWDAPIGTYRFVVIGRAAFEKMPESHQKWVQPASRDFDPEHSDYVGCVGDSPDATRRLLTAELNRIEKGAGTYFARLSSPRRRGDVIDDEEEPRERRDGQAKDEREEVEQRRRREGREEEEYRGRREGRVRNNPHSQEITADAVPDYEEPDMQQDYYEERTDRYEEGADRRRRRHKTKKEVAKDGGTRGSVEGLIAAGLSALAMQYGLPQEVVDEINIANISLIIGFFTLAGRVLEALVADGKREEE